MHKRSPYAALLAEPIKLGNQMINDFIRQHPTTATVMLTGFLIVMGYVESRIFSKTPVVAGITWVWALIVPCLTISALPASGFAGVLFLVVWVIGGIAGIVYYLNRRRDAG